MEEQLIAGVPAIPSAPAIPVAQEAIVREKAKPETPTVSTAHIPSATVQESPAAPVATDVPVKPTASVMPSAPASEGNQRVLRPIRAWAEIVDRVRVTSPMAASFFGRAKAYTTESGQVVVKFAGDFERDMARGEGAPEALRAALSVSLGRKMETQDIVSETENVSSAEDSLIDLILEAAEGAD